MLDTFLKEDEEEEEESKEGKGENTTAARRTRQARSVPLWQVRGSLST